MIFGSGKKKLAIKLIGAVDVVKLILYKLFMEIYEKKYEGREDPFYKGMAEASVNEVFGCHNNMSNVMYQQYMEMVIEGIEDLGKNYSDLKGPITDALRVLRKANEILTGEITGFLEEVDNVTNRSLFLKERKQPDPDVFMEMVGKLTGKYYLD